MKNYADRPRVLKQKVKPLGCAWPDVLFFSCINPVMIFAALEMLDLLKEHQTILQFPISALQNKPFCLYKETDKISFSKRNATINSYVEPKTIPTKTLEYFIECAKTNDNPFIFYGIPHILLKAPLDISIAKEITYHSIRD